MRTRRVLLQGDWKLVQYNLSKGGKPELYDLSEDPCETNDLAAQESQRVAKMMKIMDDRHIPSPIFPNRVIDL